MTHDRPYRRDPMIRPSLDVHLRERFADDVAGLQAPVGRIPPFDLTDQQAVDHARRFIRAGLNNPAMRQEQEGD